jgi:D-alanyl-D-alanine carboxypeptidase
MLWRLGTIVALLLVLSVPRSVVRAAPTEATRAQVFPVPPVRALSAAVVNGDTGQFVMGWNAYRRLPMASTTKMMTAFLALQLGALDDHIVVPAAAFNFEGDATVMGLHAGQTVTLRDLLYGLLLPSGADAANTIAIHYAGSESAFVDLMNREAARLGMHDTHYATAHGLPAPQQYTSAYDLALLGEYVSGIPALMKITSTRSYTWDGRTLTNVNQVLFWYPGVDGIKPGFTYEAGLCQVIDVRRDGRHMVIALLHTPDLDVDARDLLNWSLGDFSWVRSKLPGDTPTMTLTGTGAGGRYAYYVGSGHYIRGAFLDAFQTAGGLLTLGFPRTEELAEGGRSVQYFQNGVLALDRRTGTIQRLALGAASLPRPSATPTARPRGAPQPTATARSTAAVTPTSPAEATFPPAGTPAPHQTRGAVQVRSTPTPLPASTQVKTPAVAWPFATFVRLHATFLGRPIAPPRWITGDAVQIFRYGAIVYDGNHRVVAFLPLGDRLLAGRGFLPTHPGNTYPIDFASPALMRDVGWF